MLNFWYSERCTREIKLVTAISVCAIIYYCSSLAKLSVTWTLISLAIGVVTHLLQLLGAKFAQSRPDTQRLNLFLTAVPVFAVIVLIYFLPSQAKIWLAIQAVGFCILGFIILSIHHNRAKRSV